jgi:hypothetical protein
LEPIEESGTGVLTSIDKNQISRNARGCQTNITVLPVPLRDSAVTTGLDEKSAVFTVGIVSLLVTPIRRDLP